MLAFLLETRKDLLDHLVTMHDQYIMEMCRQAKHLHEQKHRELRKRQKRAIDVVLEATDRLLDWPADTVKIFLCDLTEIFTFHRIPT
jgi:hypothetical protein